MSEQQKQGEREAFEAWWRNRNPKLPPYRRDMPGSERFGEYCSKTVQDQWEAWQSRAALSQQSQGEAAQETEPHVCRIEVKDGKVVSYGFQQLHGNWSDGEYLLYRAAPAPSASTAEQEGGCKCRRLGDWNGEHHPLCDGKQWAASPAALTDEQIERMRLEACDIGTLHKRAAFAFARALLAAQPAEPAPAPVAQADGFSDATNDQIAAVMLHAGNPKGLERAIRQQSATPAAPAPASRQGVALSNEEVSNFAAWAVCSVAVAKTVIRDVEARVLSRASSSRAEVEIPEGWKLVPAKPTIAMCIRGAAGADNVINGHAAAQCYEFMLAAAEAPNAGEKA